MCSNDDGGNEEDGSDISVINLTKIRQLEHIMPTKFGVTFGSSENPTLYTTSNLFFGQNAGYNTSLVGGRYETNSNTNALLSISMLLDRQATLDYNMQYRDDITVFVIDTYAYNNYYDTLISSSNIEIKSKNNDAILINENGTVGLTNYIFGNGNETIYSNNTLWFPSGNTDGPNGEGFIYSEQNTFNQETTITITEFTDYRMLTYLRYLMSKSNNSSLIGIRSDNSQFNFNLDYSTDLLALSHQFDDEGIVKFQFVASSDFEIHLFRGIITSDESPENVFSFFNIG